MKLVLPLRSSQPSLCPPSPNGCIILHIANFLLNILSRDIILEHDPVLVNQFCGMTPYFLSVIAWDGTAFLQRQCDIGCSPLDWRHSCTCLQLGKWHALD